MYTYLHAISLHDALPICVFGSAVLDIVPRIVLEFRKRYPNVEVVLHNMDRDTQVKALQERRIAIGFNRFFLEYPGLQWERDRKSTRLNSSHSCAARLPSYASKK